MDDHATKQDFSVLRQLDLSATATVCYEVLYLNGWLTAGKLAKLARKPRTSVYHALEQLERKGFVERNKVVVLRMVTRFRAVRLDKALENLAIYQRRAVQDLIDYQIERSIERQVDGKSPPVRKDWR